MATVPAGYVAFPSTQPDIFGPIGGFRDVRRSLLQTIRTWSATYIAEVADVYDLNMTDFSHWKAVFSDRALPAGLEAACWTTCVTTDPRDPPKLQGDGTWSARYIANANIAVYGENWEQAADLVGAYIAAVRTLVLQHRSLGGLATTTKWVGEASKEIEHQRLRTVQQGIVMFAVTVDGVTNSLTGPPNPTVAPGSSAGPTVDQVDVVVANALPDETLSESEPS